MAGGRRLRGRLGSLSMRGEARAAFSQPFPVYRLPLSWLGGHRRGDLFNHPQGFGS